MVRADEPWTMNHGYNANPEATARAWRNGWFHTGDAFRRDQAGNFFFVDRMKDAIRRRGENISSFEVEAEIRAHPKVRETAVVGVPSEFGEDEVMAIVAPVPGAEIDPLEFVSFLTPRLPYFMVPRYIRFVEDLPKTPTQKIQKHVLRSEGITNDTWDREQAGIRLKREKLKAGDLKVRAMKDETKQRADLKLVLEAQAQRLDAARPDAVARQQKRGRWTARQALEAIADETALSNMAAW